MQKINKSTEQHVLHKSAIHDLFNKMLFIRSKALKKYQLDSLCHSFSCKHLDAKSNKTSGNPKQNIKLTININQIVNIFKKCM